jgi:RNA polymerase sigma factor (sigma-70 family)
MPKKKQNILDAVQQYSERLYRFIRNRVSNDEDAEDILQDVWYQLSSLVDVEAIEQLSAWLYRVSRNRIADKYRKQKTLSLEDLAYADEDEDLPLTEDFLVDAINPEVEFERMYFMESFLLALSELPVKQREVFVLNEMEDLTLQEIADKTGESIKTIISRKHYAIVYLRKRLQNQYDK